MSGPEVSIVVDRDRCDLYGRCAEEAPGLLRLEDGDEELVVLRRVVPAEHLDAARRATQACPKSALSLT